MEETSNALAVRENTALTDQGYNKASISTVLQHRELVTAVMEQVMQENIHYGPGYPGDKKLNLLKPGADALGVAFQLVPEFELTSRDFDGMHREYQVTCKIRARNGNVVAHGVGTCSTLESKYRYRFGKRKCPTCQAETIIKTKTGRNPGGYWCVPDKGGCGANFDPGCPEIENQDTGKVLNPDPADQWNTCLKIAKKRAYVDGMITATGVSDKFTQDAEEAQHEAPKAEGTKASEAIGEWTPIFKLTDAQKEAAKAQGWKTEERTAKSSGRKYISVLVPAGHLAEPEAEIPMDGSLPPPAPPKLTVKDMLEMIDKAKTETELNDVWKSVVSHSDGMDNKSIADLARARRDKATSLLGGR